MMSGLTGWMPCYDCGWFVVVVACLNGGAEGDEKVVCGGGRRKNQAKFYVAYLFTPLKSKSA